jgi:hypothetical protein
MSRVKAPYVTIALAGALLTAVLVHFLRKTFD